VALGDPRVAVWPAPGGGLSQDIVSTCSWAAMGAPAPILVHVDQAGALARAAQVAAV
jgi:hypothetical protein